MTSRRKFLSTLSALPLVASAVWPKSGAAAPQRPNFLILLTDDQRFDTIRALGQSEVVTPNLDRLVKRGVTFTHCQTQGGLSGAICMPSRAQLMTGRSVFQVHREIVDRQNQPDPEVLTFPEVLRRNGYVTFHTGKWHNGPVLFQRSFSQGAEIFFGGMSDQLRVPVFDYSPDGTYPKEKMRVREKFSSEMFADATVQFLRGHDQSKPFLCFTSFTSPHDPRMAPQRFADRFPEARVKIPKNFLPQHPFDNGEMKVRDELLAPFPRTEAEIRKHIAGYYAMVAEVDDNIGRILDTLEQSGAAANTYIIFAGDNGLAVGQHGLLGKQNLYDHSIRVPLIISGPDIPQGRRNGSLCQLMDLAPTVSEMAGVPLPTMTQGQSLLGAAKSGGVVNRDATISAYRNVQRAIRTRDWKLIEYQVNGTRTTQLFHLSRDPWEMRDLSGEAAQAARIRELRARMVRLLREAGDGADWLEA
jgi:arylsulfatase A-like enzyme